MKTNSILIALLGVILVFLVSIGLYLSKAPVTLSEPVFCAQDVRQCPDGTFVNRVAPSCDFDKCPDGKPLEITIYCVADGCQPKKIFAGAGTLVRGCYRSLTECDAETASTTQADDLKIFKDAALKLEFRYPEKISSGYVNPVQWPPSIKVGQGPLVCSSEPTGTSSPEVKAISKTIKGEVYCLKTSIGAAAGSTYADYAYQIIKEGRLLTLSFTLQTPRCENYDAQRRLACEKEQAGFDVDALADGIISSLKFD
jgi:hypothetical protein